MTSDDWCLESEGRTQLGIAGREECKASVRSKPSDKRDVVCGNNAARVSCRGAV